MNTKYNWVTASFLFFLCILLANTAKATRYSLTLITQGSGTIMPDNTNNPYPANATITITATPGAGWYFGNWSGDASGTNNPLPVTMTSDLVITGKFLAFPTYSLTLNTNGQGAISLSPPGGSYLSNQVVTATATPAAGWKFVAWFGATNSGSNPVSMTMNTNASLTALFAQLPAFDVQPVGVTNHAGSTVNFSAHAVGNAPVAYQWYFSGGTLSNATTPALSLTNVSAAQAGNYWVVATNNYGSATSHLAALTLTNGVGPTNLVNSPDETSLRAAIALGGWVGLRFNGTVTITNTINITNQVVLDGTGVAATIGGGNAVRLFYVTNGASLTITNLTLANGSCIITNGGKGTPADGGAIYINGGALTLVACTVTGNNAQSLIFGGLARGGALFNDSGVVFLQQTSLSNNAAIGGGPANPNPDVNLSTGIGFGGAIYTTNGAFTMAWCNVTSNLCEGLTVSGGSLGTGLSMGGSVFQASGLLTVTKSVFTANLALGSVGVGSFTAAPSGPAYGGALAITGGSVLIDHSQFSANASTGGNAGNVGSGASGFGGAIYSDAILTVTDSSLFGNHATAGGSLDYHANGSVDGFGGAIYNSGTAVINRCPIYSNYVQGGILGTYFGEKTTGFQGLGGGVFNAAQFGATNCTIALNSAVGGLGSGGSSGLGTSGNAIGGGLFNQTGATFDAMNLTIVSNNCSSPSGERTVNGFIVGCQIGNTNGTVRLRNTLIAYSGANSNAYGPITDDGYNICSDGSTGWSGGSSFNNTDPQLAPLGDYGGPTLCMALLPSSPAIDSGDPYDYPTTDQRGYLRPVGDGPDIGAYEFGAAPPLIPDLAISANGTNILLSFTAYPLNVYRLQWSTNLATWTDLNTNGPFANETNLSQTISKQGFGSRYFRLVVP